MGRRIGIWSDGSGGERGLKWMGGGGYGWGHAVGSSWRE